MTTGETLRAKRDQRMYMMSADSFHRWFRSRSLNCFVEWREMILPDLGVCIPVFVVAHVCTRLCAHSERFGPLTLAFLPCLSPLFLSLPLSLSLSIYLSIYLSISLVRSLVAHVAVSSDACRSDASQNDGNRGVTLYPLTNHATQRRPCVA